MVRTTLDQILLRLPKLLKDRYGGNANIFWINAYNDLLNELEQTKCGPKQYGHGAGSVAARSV